MELTKKQIDFLREVNLNRDRKTSITEIGNKYFKCKGFVYKLLNKFSSEGIIIIQKGRKQLVVSLTDKGKELIK